MHVIENKSAGFIAKELKKGSSTVRTILKNKDQILKQYFAAPTTSNSTSYNRDMVMVTMEKSLIQWIKSTRRTIGPPCGKSISDKAIELHEFYSTKHPDIKVKPFNASAGWLASFKKRHYYDLLSYTSESELGMVSNKMLIVTIFGHYNNKQNVHYKI